MNTPHTVTYESYGIHLCFYSYVVKTSLPFNCATRIQLCIHLLQWAVAFVPYSYSGHIKKKSKSLWCQLSLTSADLHKCETTVKQTILDREQGTEWQENIYAQGLQMLQKLRNIHVMGEELYVCWVTACEIYFSGIITQCCKDKWRVVLSSHIHNVIRYHICTMLTRLY